MSAARKLPDAAPANDVGLSDRDLERLADLLAPRLAALLGASQATKPYVTKDELAARWRVSTATVDRMVRQGMPFERMMGDKRFDAGACDAWRRARPAPAEEAKPAEADVPMDGVRKVAGGGKGSR